MAGADLLVPAANLAQLKNGKEVGEGSKAQLEALAPSKELASVFPAEKWGDRVEEEGDSILHTAEAESKVLNVDQVPIVPAKSTKTWTSVVGNRVNGMKLDFVAPAEYGVVEFTQEDIEAGFRSGARLL